jgi:hypothetical protein
MVALFGGGALLALLLSPGGDRGHSSSSM